MSMMGTCEGYTCYSQHNAPNKIMWSAWSQDGGRLGERARARAQHVWCDFLAFEVQSHASAMLAGCTAVSRWRHMVEGHPRKISRKAAAIATN